jgi:hypothetical protein
MIEKTAVSRNEPSPMTAWLRRTPSALARDRGTGLKVHPVRAELHGNALSSSTKA